MTKTGATTRKQAQRQRDKSAGINEIRARLEPEEYAMLTEGAWPPGVCSGQPMIYRNISRCLFGKITSD